MAGETKTKKQPVWLKKELGAAGFTTKDVSEFLDTLKATKVVFSAGVKVYREPNRVAFLVPRWAAGEKPPDQGFGDCNTWHVSFPMHTLFSMMRRSAVVFDQEEE